MRIIPAIDIINGKCVRLTKGDYATQKIYNENPLEVAKEFALIAADLSIPSIFFFLGINFFNNSDARAESDDNNSSANKSVSYLFYTSFHFKCKKM